MTPCWIDHGVLMWGPGDFRPSFFGACAGVRFHVPDALFLAMLAMVLVYGLGVAAIILWSIRKDLAR